jgi:GT2 family glycosyltransferase
MKPTAMRPTCVELNNPRQPYYLVSSKPLAAHDWYKLCALCSWLNQMGFESYIQAANTTGRFWAPLLSSQVQAAHYRAGKKPVVLQMGLAAKNPLGVGMQSHIWWDAAPSQAQISQMASLEHLYVQGGAMAGSHKRLHLPIPELTALTKLPVSTTRDKALLYQRQYSGPIAPEWQKFERVDADFSDKLDKLATQLSCAQFLYTYEWSDLTVLARWAGCAVVLIPNEQCLPERSIFITEWGEEGLAWGNSPEEMAFATSTIGNFQRSYREILGEWQNEIQDLIDDTQERANSAGFSSVWPQSGIDTLAELFTEPDQQSARADRLKWVRVHEQYDKWMQRSSLREIDAQIYAEHLMSAALPQISVVIDHCGASLGQLADTLDSLSAAFGQAQWIGIVSDKPAPDAFEFGGQLAWLDQSDWMAGGFKNSGLTSPYTLVVKAGTLLAPNALVEWRLAAQINPEAKIIYADEDLQKGQGEGAYPHFKPDINVELLRCTNYLGNAMLIKSADWQAMGAPLFAGQLYGAALDMLAHQGKVTFGHVDMILFHSFSEYSAKLENAEFEAARLVLKASQPNANLTPLPRLGTWLLQSPAPNEIKVSMVVSTGAQTGYLSSLLASLARYEKKYVDDVVLVCQESQCSEIELVVEATGMDHVRVVTLREANYNHSQALNAGVAQASHEYILIADDDTELLELDCLAPMLGILSQGDVACVAPRLVTSIGADPKIVAGPVILGIGGSTGTYVGESQGLAETGVYSRLQLSQDVCTVAGHFFLMKRADWKEVGGFDETTFAVFNSVLDFCLKLTGLGKRHVWTPLTNVLHQGGKTLEVCRRDIHQKISLAEQEISERKALHARWAKQLATDPYYNRHLSLIVPFDIEADIVVDWQPRRHDRPRVLALPMGSGAGQYRVVEPLNALQDAGLAQTCAVLPFGSGGIRLMQPLELVRAAPDRLILQHSIDDGQLSLIDGFKNAAPDIKIIQTVDDLLGEVSDKHPNHKYQIREGHPRMRQALTKSDRLIVTTQTLADHYKKYVDDVHIVPNTLGQQWKGLRKPPQQRSRLRVGWVGAGQHHGDLAMINCLVHDLAAKVDWVFMGMCTDEIKPLLKEFHGFVSIGDYPKKMSELDLDIAIAPIEDNFFNRCKSNLRLLEYGAMGWPVVCSDVYPYRTDDPPVLRVKNSTEEWIDAIESLFDPKTRHAKGDALYQWVSRKYLLSNKTSTWFKAIFE